MNKIWDIGKLVALVLVIAWSVSFAAQQKENTYWIDEERYDRQEARITYKEIDCGKDAKDCDKQEQDTIKRWKRRLKKLGKKLGYE